MQMERRREEEARTRETNLYISFVYRIIAVSCSPSCMTLISAFFPS